jgi:hypothetical protein
VVVVIIFPLAFPSRSSRQHRFSVLPENLFTEIKSSQRAPKPAGLATLSRKKRMQTFILLVCRGGEGVGNVSKPLGRVIAAAHRHAVAPGVQDRSRPGARPSPA